MIELIESYTQKLKQIEEMEAMFKGANPLEDLHQKIRLQTKASN